MERIGSYIPNDSPLPVGKPTLDLARSSSVGSQRSTASGGGGGERRSRRPSTETSLTGTDSVYSAQTPNGGTNRSSTPDAAADAKMASQYKLGKIFSTINRSLDELYLMCEDEGDENKCRDANGFLERAAHDFMKLIDRIQEQRKFERKETSGISWEVRKPTSTSWRLGHEGSVSGTTATNSTHSAPSTPNPSGNHANKGRSADKHAKAGTHGEARSTRSARRERGAHRGKGDVDASPEILGVNHSASDSNGSSNSASEPHPTKGFFSRLRAAALPYDPTPAEALILAQQDIQDMGMDAHTERSPVRKCNGGVTIIKAVGSKITISQQTDDFGDDSVDYDHTTYDDDTRKALTTITVSAASSNSNSNHMNNPRAQIPKLHLNSNGNSNASSNVTTPRDARENNNNSQKGTTHRKDRAMSSISVATDGTNNSGSHVNGNGHGNGNAGKRERGGKRSRKGAVTSHSSHARSTTSENIMASTQNSSSTAATTASTEAEAEAEAEEQKNIAAESEQVWAAAEAWVEAEVQAEEAEWAKLSAMRRAKNASRGGSGSTGTMTPCRQENYTETEGGGLCIMTASPNSNPNKPNNALDSGTSTGHITPQRLRGIRASPTTGGSGVSSGGGGGGGRSLHDKLSSPERRKARELSPTEAKRRHEARQIAAESNRDIEIAAKIEKASIASTRVKEYREREALRLATAEEALTSKLNNAERNHAEQLKIKKGRAGNENAKVSEVMFINTINGESVADELQRRLAQVEARTLAAYDRRQERLSGIAQSHQKRNSRKASQMSALRLQLEEQKMVRWERLQERLAAVQQRKEARIQEMVSTSTTSNTASSTAANTPLPQGNSHDSSTANAMNTTTNGTGVALFPEMSMPSRPLTKSKNTANKSGTAGGSGGDNNNGGGSRKQKLKRNNNNNKTDKGQGTSASTIGQDITDLDAVLIETAKSSAAAAILSSSAVASADVATVMPFQWSSGSHASKSAPGHCEDAFNTHKSFLTKRLVRVAIGDAQQSGAGSGGSGSGSGSGSTDGSLQSILSAISRSGAHRDTASTTSSSTFRDMLPLQGKVGAFVMHVLVCLGYLEKGDLICDAGAGAGAGARDGAVAATPDDSGDSVWRTVHSPAGATDSSSTNTPNKSDNNNNNNMSKSRSRSGSVVSGSAVYCTSGCRKIFVKQFVDQDSPQLFDSYTTGCRASAGAGAGVGAGAGAATTDNDGGNTVSLASYQLSAAGTRRLFDIFDAINTSDSSAMKAFITGGGLVLLRIYFSPELGILHDATSFYKNSCSSGSGSSSSSTFQKAISLLHCCCMQSYTPWPEIHTIGLLVADIASVMLNHWSNFFKSVLSDKDSIESANGSGISSNGIDTHTSTSAPISIMSSHSNTPTTTTRDINVLLSSNPPLSPSSLHTAANASNNTTHGSGYGNGNRGAIPASLQASSAALTQELADTHAAVTTTGTTALAASQPTTWAESDVGALPNILEILTYMIDRNGASTSANDIESKSHMDFVWYVFASGVVNAVSQFMRAVSGLSSSHLAGAFNDTHLISVIKQTTVFMASNSRYLRTSAFGAIDNKCIVISSVTELSPRKFAHPRGKEMLSILRSSTISVAMLGLIDTLVSTSNSARVGDISTSSHCNNHHKLGAVLVSALVSVASVDINLLQKMNQDQQTVLGMAISTLLKAEIDMLEGSCDNSNTNASTSKNNKGSKNEWSGGNSSSSTAASDSSISDILALLGLACLRNSSMQELCARPLSLARLADTTNKDILLSPTEQPLIVIICRIMPAKYFTDEKYKIQLLPTLVTMCLDSSEGLQLLRSHVSSDVLRTHMSNLIRELDILNKSGACALRGQLCQLSSRFPTELWSSTLYQLSEA